MSTLVTLTEYKRAIKESGATLDQYHQDALDAAEAAVLAYPGARSWGSATTTATRTYAYTGGGFLDIDDCQGSSITTVTLGGAALASGWRWKPEGPPSAAAIAAYLELPVIAPRSAMNVSLGEMGFTQNLDQFLASGGAWAGGTFEIAVTVTAAFGWPTAPADVKRAIIWTAQAFESITPSTGTAGDLASHSVAEVSETYFGQFASSPDAVFPDQAIPAHARSILDAYARSPKL